MSQARVHRAAKARKEWTCGKCRTTVKVGEPVLSFSVGFRGSEQRRCDKPSCYPTRAERESSMVGSVYEAVDTAAWDSAGSLEDLQQVMQDIASAAREVAQDYENSGMYDKNEELQERAGLLNEAADALDSWEPDEDQPDEDQPDEDGTWDGNETYEDAYDAWFFQTREEARQFADEVELP